jgi:hypothetical protein
MKPRLLSNSSLKELPFYMQCFAVTQKVFDSFHVLAAVSTFVVWKVFDQPPNLVALQSNVPCPHHEGHGALRSGKAKVVPKTMILKGSFLRCIHEPFGVSISSAS